MKEPQMYARFVCDVCKSNVYILEKVGLPEGWTVFSRKMGEQTQKFHLCQPCVISIWQSIPLTPEDDSSELTPQKIQESAREVSRRIKEKECPHNE